MRTVMPYAVLMVLLGCGSNPNGGRSPDPETNPGNTPEVSAPAQPAPPSQNTVPGGENTPPPPVVRFIAIGDTGNGNAEQYEVGKAMADKCNATGCDFVVLLGDNIYDSGISSPDDPQMKTKFEQPFAPVNAPFYAVLGNHDYGVDGLGLDFSRAKHQIEYTKRSTKWKMPAEYYRFTKEHVDLIALDTNKQMYGQDGDQERDVKKWLGESKARWKIALGHHPYKSNGPHGNAGDYDGQGWIPYRNGDGVKDFLEDIVCGKADLYLSGHDHSMQYLTQTCAGTELVVSGAGSKPSKLSTKNPVRYQASKLGFAYITAQGDTLTLEFFNTQGVAEFTRVLTR